MAKINILPSKVYNRIAAGEVVDRPCSVVKELVENAIDAGATEIEIYVEGGGKQLVRVVDNGCGIGREDLQSAFLPHATSKISKAEDLEGIVTLGFRGEAIASISAVSQMTIISKTEGGECYSLCCNGGELGQITPASGQKGADVRVEMLFYHTPVRLGFLKADKTEEAEITAFVSKFILNRSDIAFTYYLNGKKTLQSFGGGDEEAMVSVYGAATVAQCYCVNAERHGIRIRGYIGNQNFFKANKSYQHVFLNGRSILNATIAAAITNAYSGYAMKRQYPFYVLHIDMPTEIVDVNVHPNKSDVRFADNQVVYGAIYSVVSAILDGQSKALAYIEKMPEIGGVDPVPAPPKTSFPVVKEIAKREEEPSSEPVFSYEQAKKELAEDAPAFHAKKKGIELPFEIEKNEEDEEEVNKPAKYPKGYIPMGQFIEPAPMASSRSDGRSATPIDETTRELMTRFPDLFSPPPDIKAGTKESEDGFLANKRYLDELDKKSMQPSVEVANCTYVGRVFNTYLLFEEKNVVYIIDQHAAHERLIFNRLQEQISERKIIKQPMLMPYVLRLNAFESRFIEERISAIEEIGFTMRVLEENAFEISEIPMDLQSIDLNAFFNEILGDISEYRGIKLENLLRDKLASAACKAAVKGGMELTKEEIEALFKLMDGNMALKCPHGRPVVVKLTKAGLEKMFKRIV